MCAHRGRGTRTGKVVSAWSYKSTSPFILLLSIHLDLFQKLCNLALLRKKVKKHKALQRVTASSLALLSPRTPEAGKFLMPLPLPPARAGPTFLHTVQAPFSLHPTASCKDRSSPYSISSCKIVPDSIDPIRLNPPGSSSIGFPTKKYGSSCHFLLQGTFSAQRSSSSLGSSGTCWQLQTTTEARV